MCDFLVGGKGYFLCHNTERGALITRSAALDTNVPVITALQCIKYGSSGFRTLDSGTSGAKFDLGGR